MLKDFVLGCVAAYTPLRLSTVVHLILLWSSMLLVAQELAIAGAIDVSQPASQVEMATHGALLVVLLSHVLRWLLVGGQRGGRH